MTVHLIDSASSDTAVSSGQGEQNTDSFLFIEIAKRSMSGVPS